MMSALSDPAVMEALMRLIEGDAGLQRGPVYPKWYKPGQYPTPDATRIAHKARRDREDYQDLIARWRSDRNWLQLASVGVFDEHDPEFEEEFHDAALALDANLVTSLLAGTEIIYKVTPPTTSGRQDAEKIEDFGIRCREHTINRHYLTHAANLAVDEVKTAITYGHIVCRRLPDFEAESDEIPVAVDFLDPATCFPTWQAGRGINTMTRIYLETVENIIGTWDTEDNKVHDKLMARKYKQSNGQERDRLPNDELEVIEYWDRRWHTIIVDNEIIHKWEHKFSFVPFVYIKSGLGDASQVTEGSSTMFGVGSTMNRRRDLASKGMSIVAYTKKTHEQKEAIMGRMFTELKKTSNPPRTFEQDGSVYGDAPLVSSAEGAVNMLRMNYEREVNQALPQGFQLAPPVLAAVSEAQMRGLMPAESYGSPSGSQQSGSSIESLNESGRDKLTPWLLMLTEYHKQCFEMDLRFFRDWGHLMGSDMKKGAIFLETTSTNVEDEPLVQVTPEMLRNGKMRTSVKMTSLRLQNLGPLGNAVGMWKNMGLIEDVEALDLRGVSDAGAMLRRIEIQEFKKMDEFKKPALIKWLREEGEYEMADMAETMLAAQSGLMGGGGAPGQGPPPGPPGLGPGSGAGTNGGAPPGPNGPQMGRGLPGS
ncbi:MAG TPA: hypothetical protein VNJ04_19510, partial [Gemmatimonadaceae bacterium]|nr:hypothetical protein [Gemmatimonadaceae bacterium]